LASFCTSQKRNAGNAADIFNAKAKKSLDQHGMYLLQGISLDDDDLIRLGVNLEQRK